MSKELVFFKDTYDFPVALLGDIRVFFMHYQSEDEAQAAWERRKSRINYNNLYIILSDTDGITKEEIIDLQKVKCKNIIVLSNKDRNDIKHVHQINCESCKNFTDYDRLGFRVFEKQWDFVDWLNSSK